MKCFQCRKEIKPTDDYEITAPDGDAFHKECLPEYEKDKEKFFSETIYNDKKFEDLLYSED